MLHRIRPACRGRAPSGRHVGLRGIRGRLRPAEHAAAAIAVRALVLFGDDLRHGRTVGVAFQPARLRVEPLQRGELLVAAELGVARPPTSARGWSRRRPRAAPGTGAGPCRHARTRSAPGSVKRQGAPCTTSATMASAAHGARADAGRRAEARRNPPARARRRRPGCRAAGAATTSLGADVVMRRA